LEPKHSLKKHDESLYHVAVLDQPIRKQEKHRPSEILAELELFLEKKHREFPKI
jgi:hypothetical protein